MKNNRRGKPKLTFGMEMEERGEVWSNPQILEVPSLVRGGAATEERSKAPGCFILDSGGCRILTFPGLGLCKARRAQNT